MKRYGDIRGMCGAEIAPVDVVTGGSPCQDLSVAGKRAGLAGERSGLFLEQIRVVKEMRDADRDRGRTGELIRPRYLVWENVAGAFSSNGGKDFQAVLSEIVKIVEPDAPDVPLPDKGRWPSAGGFFGVGADGCPFSVAWRTHDAQFWGVPQRRRRICVLADFGGYSAGEILFDPQFEREAESAEPDEALADFGAGPRPEVSAVGEGVSGHFEPRGAAGEGTAAGAESGADGAICLQGNGIDRADANGCNRAGWRRGESYTLNTIDRPAVATFDVRQPVGPAGGARVSGAGGGRGTA